MSVTYSTADHSQPLHMDLGVLGMGSDGPGQAPIHESQLQSVRTCRPSTGEMFEGGHITTNDEDYPNYNPVGLTPPMDETTVSHDGQKVSKCDVLVRHDDKVMPASKALLLLRDKPMPRYSLPQFLTVEQYYTEGMHALMFMSSFLEMPRAHSGLYEAFEKIPLQSINEEHPLLNDYVREHADDGPPGQNTLPQSAGFSAEPDITSIRGRIGDLYSGRGGLNGPKMRKVLWARAERHNRAAFEAVRGIGPTYEMGRISVPKGGRPETDAAGEICRLIRNNLVDYGSMMTHVIMGPGMRLRYLANLYSNNVAIAADPDYRGIGPMPGFGDLVLITDWLVEAHTPNTIYLLDRPHGAFYGQGPLITDTRSKKFPNSVEVHEYYQYMIADNHLRISDTDTKRQTSFKIEVAEPEDDG